MLSCAFAEPLLEPYLDGRLVEAQARWVERHAARCPACGARLEEGRRLRAALRRAAVPAMPADLKERLKAALAEVRPEAAAVREEPEPDFRPAAALAFGLAALAVFVSGSLTGPGLPSQACSNNVSSVCSFGGGTK